MTQKLKTIMILIFALAVVGLIIKNVYERRSINKNGVYVVGSVDKIQGAYQGVRIYVSYKYQGRIIKNDFVSSDFDKSSMKLTKFFLRLIALPQINFIF